MSRDFRSQQMRISQLIASGTSPFTTPALTIYSASAADDDQGTMNTKLLQNVGNDVWFYISGSDPNVLKPLHSLTGSMTSEVGGTRLRETTTLFGGRVAYSGAINFVSNNKSLSAIHGASGSNVSIFSDQSVFVTLDQLKDSSGDINKFAVRNEDLHQVFVVGENGNVGALGTGSFAGGELNINSTDGSSDPRISFQIDGTDSWTMGVDDSDSDKFKITDGSAFGTDNLVIDTSGNTTVLGDLTVSGTDVYGGSDVDFNFRSDVGFNFYTDSDNDSTAFFKIYNGAGVTGTSISENGDLILGYTSGGSAFGGDLTTYGSAVFNENSEDKDFRVETAGLASAIMTIGSQDAVAFNRNVTTDIAQNDVNFYVKGLPGNKDTVGTRGTALFTGDVVISGTLYAEKQVMEVETTTTGHLNMSGAITFKNQGAAADHEGNTNLSIPANDGSIFAATGSMYARTADASGNISEIALGRNYHGGNGIAVQHHSTPDTTFSLDIQQLTSSLDQDDLDGNDWLAISDNSQQASSGMGLRETKRITVDNFIKNLEGNGIRSSTRTQAFSGSAPAQFMTDDAIVAHLSGSVFSGEVGISGSAAGFALSTIGMVGVGVSDPDAHLEVMWPNTSGRKQLKLSYDSDSFATLDVDSSGNLTIEAPNNDADISFVVDDNGTDITAFKIDGSEKGSALFTPASGGGVTIMTPAGNGQIILSGSGETQIVKASNTPSDNPVLLLKRSRGTIAARTAVSDDDTLGSIAWQGFDTDHEGANSAAIVAKADGAHGGSSTDTPGKLLFATSPDGSSTLTERMVIRQDGKVGIGTSVPVAQFVVSGSTETYGGDAVVNRASGDVVQRFQLASQDVWVQGIDATDNSFKINNGDLLGVSKFALDSDGDVTITGDLQVKGNDIKGSGGTAITMDGSGNVTVAGDLTVSGGDINGPTDGALNIRADLGVSIHLDEDNNGTNNFSILDGANATVFQVSEAGDAVVAGDLSVDGGDIFDVGNVAAIHLSGSGDVGVFGDLTVWGNDIKDHSGNAAITFDGSSNTQVKGNLQVDGNIAGDADEAKSIFAQSTSANITLGGGGKVIAAGDLQVQGNDIQMAGGQAAITFSGTGDVAITGDLTVTGNDIKNSDGEATITMDANNNVTLQAGVKIVANALTASDGGKPIIWDTSDNVYVTNKLYVSGSTIFGPTDNDFTITSDGNLTFKIDGDADESSQHFAFQNNTSTEIARISESGDLQIDGDLTVSGNNIKDSGGSAGITFDGSGNTAIDGTLTVPTDIIHAADVNTKISFTENIVEIKAEGHSMVKADGDSNGEKEVVVNEDGEVVNFRVETDNKPYAIFTSGSKDQVLILSGGHSASYDEAKALDVAFYVSGSSQSVGTSTRGTTVIGGDLVVSGSIYGPTHTILNRDSIAENGSGWNPSATGANTVAIGKNAVASGNYSIALGTSETNQTDATGIHSTALGGDDASAGGDYSAVLGGFGNTVTSDGDYGTVLGGTSNSVSGQYSVAAGNANNVSGDNAFAFGRSLTVPENNTFAIGKSDASSVIALSGSAKVVGGTLDVSEYIKHLGDPDTYVRFTDDNINIQAGGVNFVTITEDGTQDTIIFNEGGVDVDFRVETATKPHGLFVNAAAESVLILSGGDSTSFDEAAALDVAFYVSGSSNSRGTSVRGTAVFGGDLHISGAISGPSKYALVDDNVKVYRTANTLYFKDAENDAKTLSELASLPASEDFFVGVHGGSNTSKLKATGSIAFSGASNAFVDGLSAEGVGTDVFTFFSGSIGSSGTTTRGVTLFGGDTFFSGSTGFQNVSAAVNVVATGSLIAGGNKIKNSNGDINIAFSSTTNNVLFGDAAVIDQTPQSAIHIAKSSNTQAAAANEYGQFGLTLRNDSTQTNAFSGIAFDISTEVDADSIGAAIRAQRDTSASTDATLHDANLTFATNDAGDSGLTERMRITHDGKVGIGTNDPQTTLHISGLDSIVVPVGTTAQRGTATQGGIRYNTTTSVFEGYNGSSWASLGETKDVDQDTYVRAETVAGADNDDLVFVTDGSQRMSIDHLGVIAVTGSFETSTHVTVGGDLTVTGNDIKDSGNATAFTFDGSGNISNHVGFTGNPSFSGTPTFGQYIAHTGDTDTRLKFNTDAIWFEAGGSGMLGMVQDDSNPNYIVINDGGSDHDFRIESLNEDYMFFVDGSTDRIGINYDSPAVDLHLKGDFRIKSQDTSNDIIWFYDDTSSRGVIDLRGGGAGKSILHADGPSYLAKNLGINHPSGSLPENSLTVRHTGADADDGIMIIRADGTTQDTNLLGGIGFDSTDGAVPSTITEASAFIAAYAAEDHASTDKGGDLVFGTTLIDDNENVVSHERMRILDSGLIGLGVSDPDSALEVLNTTSQLKLSYDGSNATAFTVSSGGDLTVIPSGGDVAITGNLDVSARAAIGDQASIDANTTVMIDEDHTMTAAGAGQVTVKGALVTNNTSTAGSTDSNNTSVMLLNPDSITLAENTTTIATLEVKEPNISLNSKGLYTANSVLVPTAPTEGGSRWVHPSGSLMNSNFAINAPAGTSALNKVIIGQNQDSLKTTLFSDGTNSLSGITGLQALEQATWQPQRAAAKLLTQNLNGKTTSHYAISLMGGASMKKRNQIAHDGGTVAYTYDSGGSPSVGTYSVHGVSNNSTEPSDGSVRAYNTHMADVDGNGGSIGVPLNIQGTLNDDNSTVTIYFLASHLNMDTGEEVRIYFHNDTANMDDLTSSKTQSLTAVLYVDNGSGGWTQVDSRGNPFCLFEPYDDIDSSFSQAKWMKLVLTEGTETLTSLTGLVFVNNASASNETFRVSNMHVFHSGVTDHLANSNDGASNGFAASVALTHVNLGASQTGHNFRAVHLMMSKSDTHFQNPYEADGQNMSAIGNSDGVVIQFSYDGGSNWFTPNSKWQKQNLIAAPPTLEDNDKSYWETMSTDGKLLGSEMTDTWRWYSFPLPRDADVSLSSFRVRIGCDTATDFAGVGIGEVAFTRYVERGMTIEAQSNTVMRFHTDAGDQDVQFTARSYSDESTTRTWLSYDASAETVSIMGSAYYTPAYVSVTTTSDTDASSSEYNPFDEDFTTSYASNTNASQGITYTASTGRFTVAAAGVYEVSSVIYIEQSTSAGLTMLSLKKNGSTEIWQADGAMIHSSVDPVERTITGIFTFAANDYVEVKVDGTDIVVHNGSTVNIKRIG